MTSLFPARRRAEDFAAALDAPGRSSSVDAELAELLELAAALRDRQHAAPREEFTRVLRSRLMSEARESSTVDASMPMPSTLRRRGARERRLVAAASVLAIVGGPATMAAAAQDALPGETLYAVKRGLESARTSMMLDDALQGETLLGQALERLAEVGGLLEQRSLPAAAQVPATLGLFQRQAAEGTAALLTSHAETSSAAKVASVREFNAHAMEDIEALAQQAPPMTGTDLGATALSIEVQAHLVDAAEEVVDLDQAAAQACSACGDESGPVVLPDAVEELDAEVSLALASLESPLDPDAPDVLPGVGALLGRDPAIQQPDGSTSSGDVAAPPAPTADATPDPAVPGDSKPTGAETDGTGAGSSEPSVGTKGSPLAPTGSDPAEPLPTEEPTIPVTPVTPASPSDAPSDQPTGVPSSDSTGELAGDSGGEALDPTNPAEAAPSEPLVEEPIDHSLETKSSQGAPSSLAQDAEGDEPVDTRSVTPSRSNTRATRLSARAHGRHHGAGRSQGSRGAGARADRHPRGG